MTAREMSIGDRGEELLGWLWRLGGLTASQYAALAEEADPEMVEKGGRSRGNRGNGKPKKAEPGARPDAEPDAEARGSAGENGGRAI